MEDKYFTHLYCPNCYSSMTLKQDYVWMCRYCGTKFYVLPAHKVDMIHTQKNVDEYICDRLSEEAKTDFYKYMDRDVTAGVGNYLLNNGYIEKKKVKNVIPDKNTVYEYTLRVVSLDKEREKKQ